MDLREIFFPLVALITWGVPLVALVFGVRWAIHVQRSLDQIATDVRTLAQQPRQPPEGPPA